MATDAPLLDIVQSQMRRLNVETHLWNDATRSRAWKTAWALWTELETFRLSFCSPDAHQRVVAAEAFVRRAHALQRKHAFRDRSGLHTNPNPDAPAALRAQEFEAAHRTLLTLLRQTHFGGANA
jgi:hypothetical protein